MEHARSAIGGVLAVSLTVTIFVQQMADPLPGSETDHLTLLVLTAALLALLVPDALASLIRLWRRMDEKEDRH